MNLLDLTFDASDKVDTYKNPNIAEWIAAIDPVLSAAGVSTVGGDTIENIIVGVKFLHITSTYTVRGCSDTNNIQIPIDIIKAADPVYAAKLYHVENRINKTNKAIEESRRAIAFAEQSLAALLAEKSEIDSSKAV